MPPVTDDNNGKEKSGPEGIKDCMIIGELVCFVAVLLAVVALCNNASHLSNKYTDVHNEMEELRLKMQYLKQKEAELVIQITRLMEAVVSYIHCREDDLGPVSEKATAGGHSGVLGPEFHNQGEQLQKDSASFLRETRAV